MGSSLYKAVLASLIGSVVGFGLLVSEAEAKHRWPFRWVQPNVDVWQDESDVVYEDNNFDQSYYDDTSTYDENDYVIEQPRRRARRNAWWTEDTQDLEPTYDAPPRKSKYVTLQKARKPVVKKKEIGIADSQPLTDLAKARAKFGSKPKATSFAKSNGPKLVDKPVKLQVASLDPSPRVLPKSIGCTAGAAVVTGYGFGDVKPKICTGDTYAYNAARAGKPYLIKLSAASGEILDVKRLK